MTTVRRVAQLAAGDRAIEVFAPTTRAQVRAVLDLAQPVGIVLDAELSTVLPLVVASDVVAVFAELPDEAEVEAAAARVRQGGLYCAPELADAMFHLARGSLGTRRRHELTKREVAVLELLSEGRSNRNIAEELFVSEHTVRNHLHRAFRKLGVSTRAEAVSAYATRLASRTERTP